MLDKTPYGLEIINSVADRHQEIEKVFYQEEHQYAVKRPQNNANHIRHWNSIVNSAPFVTLHDSTELYKLSPHRLLPLIGASVSNIRWGYIVKRCT